MIRALLSCLLIFALTGCAEQSASKPEPTTNATTESITKPRPATDKTATPEESAAEATSEPVDRACAFFYFLWGSHAEYNQDLEAALDAFEKALICDPSSTAIEKKIPILLMKMGAADQAAQWLDKNIQKNPRDKSQYLLLAHIRIQQMNRQEAIRLYQEALAQDPEDSGVLVRLGILYSQQMELDKAEEIFRRLLAKNHEEYYAWLYLGRLLTLRQKRDEAAAAYEKALALNWSADLVYEMVDFYADQEKYSEVMRLYNNILKKEPDNERARLGRVQTLMSMGEDHRALDELLTLQKESKHPGRLDTSVGKLLLRLGHTDEAKTLLEKHRQDPESAEARYLLALIAYQDGDFKKALASLRSISARGDAYPDAVYLQVRILREMGENSQSVSLLMKNISDAELRQPLFFVLLSSLYQEQDKNIAAMEVLNSGLRFYPTNEQILFEHALLLEKTGKPLEALQSMEKVLQFNPGNPEALNFVGYTWADQNINLEKALTYIERAVTIKPDSGFIRDSLGWVYFRLGQKEKARDELLNALKLEPEDPDIHEHLGDVYLALHLPDQAILSYENALRHSRDPEKNRLLQKKINQQKAAAPPAAN
ncbi:MAG: tetratricopeptide repeat protein [Desulfobulbaceae bacterium]|jgi:tetratricopeptide (TPR) repeat protein|nr:tetratricopeptide repeat protein [Desulfobulbaceae bacterium]